MIFRENGRKLKKYLLWAGLLLISGSALADGWYRWLDKSGTVYYGDTPPPDAMHVEKQKVDSAPSADNADMPYETRRAQQNFPVTLYVIEDCGEICQQARALLGKRGVPYTEISLKTQGEFDAFMKASGSAGVPVLAVGKVWLRNFQAGQWQDELDSAGYPKVSSYRAPAPLPASAVKPAAAETNAVP